jgi:hypothetical protein
MGMFDFVGQIPGLGANTFGAPQPAPQPRPQFVPMQQPEVNDHSTRNRWFSLLSGGPAGLVQQIAMQDIAKQQRARNMAHQQLVGQALMEAEDPQTHRIDPNRYRQSMLQHGYVPSPEELKTFDTMDYQRAKLLSEQMVAGAPKVIPQGGRLFGSNPVTGAPVDASPAAAPYTLSTDQRRFDGSNQLVAAGTPGHFEHDPEKELYQSDPGGGGVAGGPQAPPSPPGRPKGRGFQDYFDKVLIPSEGGYNAHDANGAPVNMGINQAANPDVDVKNLTREGAATLAHDRYWKVSGADNLPDDLAPIHADTAYVFGPGAAKKMLERAHGDAKTYLEIREARFRELAQKPEMAKYLKSWLNRNKRLADYAGVGPSGAGLTASVTAGAPRLLKGAVPKAADTIDPLSDAGVNAAAERYRMWGTLPPLGMGKSAAAQKKAIIERAAVLDGADGVSGADAALRLGTNKANQGALNQLQRTRQAVQSFETNAMLNADLALKLAPKGAGPLHSPVFNKWIQLGRKGIQGDPSVTQYEIALGTFLDEYAKITSGATGAAGSTDASRREAYDRLNKYASKGTLAAAIGTMKTEMHNRVIGMDQEESRLRGDIRGPANHPAAGAPKVLKFNPKTGNIE